MAVQIRPSGAACGAEVAGVDMQADLPAADIAALEQALLDHGVLVFRDQPLTPHALASFSARFGPLQPHVQRAYQHPDVPEIVVMTNRKADGTFDEAGARRGAIENTRDGWHSDLSYDPVPAKATLLHAQALPGSGGNTCFTNARRAFADLPLDIKQRVIGRTAAFTYGGHQRNQSAAKAASALDASGKATSQAEHPVINAHVATGEPAIYVNPLITTAILEVDHADSEALLETLFDALDRPAYRFEHEWRLGDTLMWDNRGGIMHTGRLDYPRDQLRQFIRTTVSGAAIEPYRPD